MQAHNLGFNINVNVSFHADFPVIMLQSVLCVITLHASV